MVKKKGYVVMMVVVIGLLALALSAVGALADAGSPTTAGPAYGVQYRGYSGLWQRLTDIEADGSASYRDVFSPAGGVYSLTFIGETLYGAECANPCAFGSPDYYLATLPRVGAVTGTRVGAVPIGISNVDGLAYCAADGKLYGVGFDFSAHQATLFTVDPATGVGTPVGTLSTDVWIVGLACDPASGTLYGISSPFATNTSPKLYAINKTPVSVMDSMTDSETLIGGLGTPLQGLAWDSDRGRLIGAFGKLYTVNTGTGAASEIGGDYTTGTAGDGVYSLAYYAGGAVPPTSTPTTEPTVTPTVAPTATPKYHRYLPVILK